MTVSHTCIVEPVVYYQKRWTPSDFCVGVPVPPGSGGREILYLSPMGKEDIGMIKSIFPPRRICCLSTFSFTWLKSQIVTKQRLRFVLIILWGWECTLSAPGLFLCRSEVLPQHTKTLLPFGWGVLALAKHLLLLQMSNCLSLLTFNICLTITEAFCSAGLFTCTCPLIFLFLFIPW